MADQLRCPAIVDGGAQGGVPAADHNVHAPGRASAPGPDAESAWLQPRRAIRATPVIRGRDHAGAQVGHRLRRAARCCSGWPGGCGRSAGDGPFTIAQTVDDLDQLRAALGFGPWARAEHSWGAELAICYGPASGPHHRRRLQLGRRRGQRLPGSLRRRTGSPSRPRPSTPGRAFRHPRGRPDRGTAAGDLPAGADGMLWVGLAGGRCFGEPVVQPLADLLGGVGAALPFGPGDEHSGGGHTREACKSQYFLPAHLPRLRLCRRPALPSAKPWT
jgi:hypothetical protein